ncbi:MAG TPA: prolyl oligopeptidase family serine peptidase [Vicinamibacterales bacterium]
MTRSTWKLAVCTAILLAGPAATRADQGQTYSGHGAESVPPEKLAQYAPEPLPPEVTRRIQTMLDVRGAAVGLIAPRGDRLYFTWNITGTPNVWRLDGAKTFPVQMTGGEDPTRIAGITPDGRTLIVSRDVGGQEDPGLYLQPADGGPLTVVHHKKGTRAALAFVTDDSRALFFSANDIRPDSYALYRYDLVSKTRELILDQPGVWFAADHRDDGGALKVLMVKATGALWREYAELDVRTKSLTPLLGQGEQVEYDVRYAPTPGEFFVATNKLGEFRRLYRWKPGGELTPVTPEMAMDVSGFDIDRPRRRLYYTVNDQGYQRLRALDARTLDLLELPVPAEADAVVIGSASHDGRFVTLGVETAKAPRSSYVFDWETRTLTQWALPTAPEIDLSRFAVARLDSYTARDGTKIPMFVRYPAHCAPEAPPREEPCPIVVEFHGGPESQATPGFSGFAQLFVDAGFIFVEPNVRGSDGYGKSWLEADNGAKRLNVITDIQDAGVELRKRFTRNGKAPRIAITGGSYGGYSALIGMTMFGGTYDVGVSIVGISNLQTFLQNTAPYRRALRASEYGDPERDAEVLQKLSPTSYLDRVKGPLLMIQGVDDPRVPAGESIQMHEALQARGVPSRLILIAGEGHGAARRGGQVVMIGHMLRFLEEHLLGGTGPATH